MGIDSKHVLPGNIILKLGDGEIAFGYIAGTKEEFPHDLIIIHLPGWTQLFGEWQRKFADNGNDFDVEILGFGYISADIVGSPEPTHRFTFSRRSESGSRRWLAHCLRTPKQGLSNGSSGARTATSWAT